MKIEVKVKDINKVLGRFRRLGKDLEEPFREVVMGGAQLIRGEAIKSIQTGAKSGRIYEKYNPRRTHRASAPGQAPASDTGNLVRNIAVKMESRDQVAVVSSAPYSQFLEFGTSKMLPRPFLFPATQRSKKKLAMAIFNRVVSEIRKLLR